MKKEDCGMLALVLVGTLLFALLACNEGANQICGFVVLVCPDSETVLHHYGTDSEQMVVEDALYWRFWDCEEHRWVAGTGELNCKLELR